MISLCDERMLYNSVYNSLINKVKRVDIIEYWSFVKAEMSSGARLRVHANTSSATMTSVRSNERLLNQSVYSMNDWQLGRCFLILQWHARSPAPSPSLYISNHLINHWYIWACIIYKYIYISAQCSVNLSQDVVWAHSMLRVRLA